MTVREGLRFFAQLHGVRGPQLDRDIEKWIEKVALGEHAAKRVDELSKGNAQKVQFLVSLLHRPPLLVLDEPFAGLDPVNVRGRGAAGAGPGTGLESAGAMVLTYVLLFSLYMAIVLYGSGVSMSVVNEKTSRVIELLVSAARPTEIMAGKLLASPRCLPGK